ncbi:MAG: signal peptidase II [Gemmatimonadetes bacterium]|nr:signal peptidase II [Gemmatimonadota bacterium]MBP6669822.1 signal peptidase II [Gemmatimonadales bacterium]MBK6779208.1 signal peptidase II [Gemmatimonadota bacterium]MBK7348479.1 signal peptidase II [Gemmatimonadota bacterium]MBK7714047.1 signal peptidase II [Gemmatimonadota bacterium]
MPRLSKALRFWPVVGAVLLTDCATKAVAVRELSPAHVPHPVAGELLRFTLAYNTGGAMSLSLGPLTRPLLTVVALVALGALFTWYRRLAPDATGKLLALALLWAGAAGNLWDRVRSPRGVVDFIDVGLGGWRFWIFNVADVAITVGAVLLAVLLAREERPRPAG